MPSPFKFLSETEFAELDIAETTAYLSDAMQELQRLEVPPELRNWHSLFRQDSQQQQQREQHPQQQQQQQPQPGDNPWDQ